MFWLTLFAGLTHAADSQAGFVTINSDGMGYIYFPRSKPLASSIFVQWLNKHQQTRCCLKINRNDLEKTNVEVGSDATPNMIINWRDSSDSSFTAYKIKTKLPYKGFFVGIAIAADKVTASSSYRLIARTNGKRLVAFACFGTEGENLNVEHSRENPSLYISFGPIEKVQPQCK